MADFAARISRVRMKDGASVTILPTPKTYHNPGGMPENPVGKLLEYAKAVAAFDEPGSRLEGFLTIGFFSDATQSVGFRIPSNMGPSLFAAYVAELVRRDAIMKNTAERLFDEKFEWVEN